MRYRDFESTAAELFGFDKVEARELLATWEDLGGTIRGVDKDDRNFWADISRSDAFDVVLSLQEYEEEPEERYPLDPRFPDDDYLYPYEEWEITAETDDTYKER